MTGIKRLVRAVWSIPETNSQLKCLLEMFIPFLSQIASINFAAAICVDRLFAVSKPNTYRLAHSYYTIFLTGLAWGYSLCLGGFYFYQSSNDVMLATCTLVGIMEESFYNYQNAQSTVLAVFTSVSYIAVLITMRFKLKVANKEQRLAQNKGNLERQITLTLSAVMFAYLVTQLASTIGLTAIEGLETQTRNTLGPLFRVLPVISSGIDFWIYLWRSNEFRSGFVSTFCFTKKTKVGSQIQSTITRSHLNN